MRLCVYVRMILWLYMDTWLWRECVVAMVDCVDIGVAHHTNRWTMWQPDMRIVYYEHMVLYDMVAIRMCGYTVG